MPTQLTSLNYNKLLADISQIYQKAREQSIFALNKISLGAYWEIGRRIVQEEQHGNLRAEYGERTLERLSGDLTQKFGKGFSASNLKYMRQFHITYQIRHTCGELEWSHYKFLSAVKDNNKRAFYEKKIIQDNWSVSDLLKQIRRDKIELVRIGFQPKGKEKLLEARCGVPLLSLTRGRLYTYKILEPEYLNPNEESAVVDCGFYINFGIPLKGIAKPKQGEIIESTKTQQGEYKFSLSDAKSNQLYTYKALVQEVVDADTLWVNIDLGFNIWIRQKLRFRGIDAPELSTQKGQKAKEFVEALLSKVEFIIIKSHGLDKYGRPLSDIFYLENEADPHVVLEKGIFLNQQLLDLGLAKLMED